MEKNFWRMDGFSIFTVHYVYVDHNSYPADFLFAQGKITVRLKGEMVNHDSPYCIIFCKVLKKDVMRFEEALGKLKDKMLLLGYNDYSAACDAVAKMIENGTKGRQVV